MLLPTSFFAGCHNSYGPLPAATIEKLRAVVASPSRKTWSEAYCYIIGGDGWTTLWQAVLAVDPTFPRNGEATDLTGRIVKPWARIPDSFTLARAIKYARTLPAARSLQGSSDQ